ncbi:hypothetical protein ABTY96_22745 [Streptomyces sp. NPDC096057]
MPEMYVDVRRPDNPTRHRCSPSPMALDHVTSAGAYERADGSPR